MSECTGGQLKQPSVASYFVLVTPDGTASPAELPQDQDSPTEGFRDAAETANAERNPAVESNSLDGGGGDSSSLSTNQTSDAAGDAVREAVAEAAKIGWVARLTSFFQVIQAERRFRSSKKQGEQDPQEISGEEEDEEQDNPVVTPKNTKMYVKMQCRIGKCRQTLNADKARNFERHLKNKHKLEFEQYEKKKTLLLSKKKMKWRCPPVTPLQISSSAADGTKRVMSVEEYKAGHEKQKKFERKLLEMITLDCLPLSLVEKNGFRSLVKHFDPKIHIPDRRTIGRSITKCYNEAKQFLLQDMQAVDDGGLHIVLDIWSTKLREAVIGYKARYVKGWTIKTCVLGFKHLKETHSAKNILQSLKNVLRDFRIPMSKVGSVTTDNAANVLSAFKPANAPNLEEEFFDEDDETDLAPNEDDIGIWDTLILDQDVCQEETEESLEMPDNSPDHHSLENNPCCAHLAQLAVNDALRKKNVVEEYLRKASEIVNFFRNHQTCYEKLKEKVGRGLCAACVTRWNSVLHSLQRIFGENPDESDSSMVDAINEILVEMKPKKNKLRRPDSQSLQDTEEGCTQRNAVPDPISESDVSVFKCIVKLLQPVARLTDTLQADGVTSSLVLMSIIQCVQELDAFEPYSDMDEEDVDKVKDLQLELKANIVARFTTKDSSLLNRKVIKYEMQNRENLIISSLLDPRIKTAPFKRSLTAGSSLSKSFPTVEKALNVLKEAAGKLYGKVEEEIKVVDKEEEVVIEDSSPAAKRMKSSIFEAARIANKSSKKPNNMAKVQAEIKRYMETPFDGDENICPLLFWKQNATQFPTLSQMAKLYLPMPASSGSIERLFSVAGAIARARRAKITISKLEMILTYKEFLLQNKL